MNLDVSVYSVTEDAVAIDCLLGSNYIMAVWQIL